MPSPPIAATVERIARLRWPLPALLAWVAAWALWSLARAWALSAPVALVLASAAGALLAWPCARPWRRAIAGGGFPLSLLALGAVPMPPWAWLLLGLPLLLAYPMRAWRDAPFFPTPAAALEGLDALVAMPRHVLDAGCGAGHGLVAMRRLWPQAELSGIEWSAPLAWASRLRCRGALVRRGDMWAQSWAGQDLVYVFQRPESMARAWAKAERELAPGAWLVSLEFPVPGHTPRASLQGPGRRPVWAYQPAGEAPAGQAHSTAAPPCR